MSESDDELEVFDEKVNTPAAEEETTEDTTLANSDVVTKYQEAAKIANSVLKELIPLIRPGVSVLDICKAGDQLIIDKLALVYSKKGKNGKFVDKGIAFPVCLSVNEIVCHYSPLDSDTAVTVLAEHDLVKIDLGCHIDGYIATVAHTHYIRPVDVSETASASAPQPYVVTGKVADVINAAYKAAEVAVRLIRPGNTNHQVTEAISKVAATYGVNAIQGTLMYQMKRYVIDGAKTIALNVEGAHEKKSDAQVFETYEVYGIDVAFSTGEGKPKDKGYRTTVYKRQIDKKYQLKQKTSRTFFTEVYKRFPTFPFSLRYISDEKNARLGLRECVTHELLAPYIIYEETKGEFVGHFKFTVLVLPKGTSKVTGFELTDDSGVVFVSSEDKVLPEDVLAILALEEGTGKKKDKKSKKKGGATVTDDIATATNEG